MKKLLLIPFALLALTACSGTTKTVYVPVTASKPTPTAPAVSEADVFVETINNEYPYVMDALGGRSALIDFGFTVCDAIDEGSTVADFAVMAIQNNVDPEMLGFIIGASVISFCPDNEWFLNQLGA